MPNISSYSKQSGVNHRPQDFNQHLQPIIHFDVVDAEEFHRVVQQQQNELMGDLMPDDDFDLNNFIIVDGRLRPRVTNIPIHQVNTTVEEDPDDDNNIQQHYTHLIHQYLDDNSLPFESAEVLERIDITAIHSDDELYDAVSNAVDVMILEEENMFTTHDD